MKKTPKLAVALLATSILNALSYGTPVVSLNWLDRSDNEEGFIVERAFAGENFSEIGRTSENVSMFEDSSPDLLPGKTVTYRVRAFNRYGESDYTNEASYQVVSDRYYQPIENAPDSLNVLQISSLTINANSVTVIEK